MNAAGLSQRSVYLLCMREVPLYLQSHLCPAPSQEPR